MKKVLSLLCAVMIVLSASAAPGKKVQAAKFQRAAVEQLRAQKNVTAKKAVKKNALAVKEFKSEFVASDMSISAASALRAPKAVAEAINVKCGSWEIEDWGTDGELTLIAEDNQYAFYFDIIYGGDATDLVLGKTYTVSDIYVGADGQYAGVFYNGEWNYGLKQLSLVKTIDEKGLVHFAGSCVDSLDAAFTFYYDEEEFIPTGDTVIYNFTTKAQMTYSAYYEDWMIKADDGKYAFSLDIFSENAESPVGNYSSANKDFDLTYTNVEVYAAPDSSNLYAAVSAKASIFVQNDTTFILADILAEDGVVYQFGAFYSAPTKQGEDTIVADSLIVNSDYYDWFGIVFVEAANEKYGVSLNLYPDTNYIDYFGSYSIGTNATGEIIINDDISTTMYSGTFSVAKTNEGLAITGKVLCENDIEYTLNLTGTGKAPAPEIPDTITGSDFELDYNPSYWELSGYVNEDIYLGILANSSTIAGHYDTKDLDDYYTYIGLGEGIFYDMTGASLDVTFENNIITVKGTLTVTSEDDPTDVKTTYLDITGTYTPPTERHYTYDGQEPFSAVIPTYDVDSSYLARSGVLYVDAMNDKYEAAALAFIPKEGNNTLVAGTYTIDNSQMPGTLYASSGLNSQGQLGYSFVGLYSAQGWTSVWFLVAGTATIDENGVITIAGLNSYNQQVNVILGKNAEGVESINADIKATKRIVNGQLVIEKNGILYNVLGTNVK